MVAQHLLIMLLFFFFKQKTAYEMRISDWSSDVCSSDLDKVYHTLAEAAVLVVLVIFLFLGSVRATFIPAITVPICLLATFVVLWLLGLSIHLLTLLAMVLAIGFVVDYAIVVLENIYHRIEPGADPLVSSYLGTRQAIDRASVQERGCQY